MPKKPTLPKDTHIAFNPYATKSCRGKFFLARIGKKITGSDPICRRFASATEANRWIQDTVVDYEKRLRQHGEAAKQMTPNQYSSALLALNELGDTPPELILDLAKFWVAAGKPTLLELAQLRNSLSELQTPSLRKISEAVDFFNHHSPNATQVRTVRQVLDEWLAAKGRRNLKPGLSPTTTTDKRTRDEDAAPRTNDYIRGIRCVARKLAADFGDRLFHEVHADELTQWLDSRPYSPNTRRHYHKDLRTIWNWAIKRRFAHSNPWHRVELPQKDPVAIGIFTPVEALALLRTAAQPEYRRLLPTIVCGFFGGVRTKETERLTWENIRLDSRRPLIDLNARVAKTRHRRVVRLSPNAVKWMELIPAAERHGRIRPSKWTKLFPALRNAAGLSKTPRNGFRHSYASYYASANGEVKAAEQLGHCDLATIKEHYQENVLPEHADAWWKLIPETTPDELAEWMKAA